MSTVPETTANEEDHSNKMMMEQSSTSTDETYTHQQQQEDHQSESLIESSLLSNVSTSVSGDASHLDVTLDFVTHQDSHSSSNNNNNNQSSSSSSEEEPIIKEFFVKKDPVLFINDRDIIQEYKLGAQSFSEEKLLSMNVMPILANQTVVVGSSEESTPGVSPSPIRRRADFKDSLVTSLYGSSSKEKTGPATAYESFKLSAERYPQHPCLGVITSTEKPKNSSGTAVPPLLGIKFETYAQVQEKALNIGSALRNVGIHPHYHVAIYSKNRPEWQITSEACHSQSIVTIALYDTLGEESSIYIMNHGEVVTLFVSGDDIFTKNVMKWVNQCEYLKHIVLFENFDNANYNADVPKWKEELKTKTKGSVQLYTFNEFAQLGAGDKRVAPTPPRSCDISTIMYTSGTTGLPKGVMLTHLNIISTIAGILCNLMRLNSTDRLLSYLPLAHILQRVAEMTFIQVGGSIGYWRGDVRKLRDDMAVVKPTLFPAVPRVLDRLYDGINDQIKQKKKIAQMIFQKSYNAKLKAIKTHGIEVKNPILDALVFNKLKMAMGNCVRGILSGGAPLRKEVQEFISVAFGCPVVQGYGLTETCAASTVQLPYDFSTGHGGLLLPCLEVKLVDVPEMNYSNKENNSGEICIRGPNISLGYYKEEEKTKEVYDQDGWFHTGDIGRWGPTGTLSIIDRKKNIFKLAQGEYVAAESIEGKLSQANYVSRLWVYGDSYKTFLVGFVTVNGPKLLEWAIQNQKLGSSSTVTSFTQLTEPQQLEHLEKLCADPQVNKMILKELERVGKEKKLLGFEMIKCIKLLPREFEFYPGCTTPKLSLVRNKLRDLFQKDIDEMYEKNGTN